MGREGVEPPHATLLADPVHCPGGLLALRAGQRRCAELTRAASRLRRPPSPSTRAISANQGHILEIFLDVLPKRQQRPSNPVGSADWAWRAVSSVRLRVDGSRAAPRGAVLKSGTRAFHLGDGSCRRRRRARCFVDCLDPAKRNNGLCATGCACRGDSAGLLHFACAVGAAHANGRCWCECLTCKQLFTGALFLRLARERCRLALLAYRPEEDGERLVAALGLTQALRESDELAEALQLGIETLTTVRRVFGTSTRIRWMRRPCSCARRDERLCVGHAADDGGVGRVPAHARQRSREDVGRTEQPRSYVCGHG